jgi:cyclic pyranopterin phosphate synthase
MSLSHVDESGRARMVDVAGKPVSQRTAIAEGTVRMSQEAFRQVRDNALVKGDVLRIAEVAGIQGGKRTAELIPLCHPLPLDQLQLACEADESLPGVRVTASVSVTARTGAEMEALTAVAVACLTVYDMVKAADRGMVIDRIRLLRKTGGTSGDWQAE